MSASPAVFIFISAGPLVDGEGIGIDGQGHVHHIGPWSPDIMKALQSAGSVMTAAGKVGDRKIASELAGIAQQIVQPHLGQIQQQVGGRAGALAGV